jgi:hypothetical protein
MYLIIAGSGKTHTFFGPNGLVLSETALGHLNHRPQSGKEIPEVANQGIVLRACSELLRARETLAKNGITVSFTAQFVELYEERVTDLLTGKSALVRRENGQIVGAVEAEFNSMEQVVEALRSGHERKKFAATEMNERSSRSHTALIIHVLQKVDVATMRPFATNGPSGLCEALRSCAVAEGASAGPRVADKLIKSQLHLIDLAGSERVKKSKAAGQRLREAVGINSSLMVRSYFNYLIIALDLF